MTDLVLVVGENESAQEVGAALKASGYEVVSAPDGFYATLVLERERPAAVVVPYQLSDMPAVELGSILAEDPQLAEVRRVLIGAPAEILGGAKGDDLLRLFDLVIPVGAVGRTLAASLSLCGGPAGQSTEGMRGNLEAVDFPELVQLLAGSGRPGVLRLDLRPRGGNLADHQSAEVGEARLYFDHGEIVHCIAGKQSGEQAFDYLLEIGLAGETEFRYERQSRADVFKLPRSIHGRADQLLLAAAARRDARRWESETSEKGKRSSA